MTGELRITRIAPHPQRSDRCIVERNGSFWLSLSVRQVAELELTVGELLTPERIAAVERASLVDAAMESAIRALTVRARSEAELATRLRRRGFPDDVVNEVLARLRRLGYLDDRAFAAAWVAERRRANPRSAALLRRELRSKGVAPEIVEEVVQVGEEEDLAEARRLVEKYRSRYSRLDAEVARRRLVGLLQRRGFSWSVIRTVLREFGDDALADDQE